MKAALTSLPPTLDKTYEELLSRIDGDEDRQLAREILELLAFSLRPLNLVKVCEFLQITPGMTQQDESKRLANPKDILSICGNLLNFRRDKNGAITLAHHSVKTYLVSDIKGEAGYFKLSADDAHRNIATKCLTYLSYDAFSDGPCPIHMLNKRYEQFPFLNYASLRWALHTQRLTELYEPVWATLKPFLFSADVGRGNFLAWVQLLIPESKNIAETPPLYYAASFGLTSVVQYLLKGGAEIESRGGRCGASPINIASYRGHVDVVKVLLDHGADPLAPDEHPGWNAIEWACFKKHSDVSDLFISQGYDIRRSAFDQNAYKEELRVKPRSNRVLDWSSIKPQELMQIQLTPPWHQNQMKRQLWWNLVGLAEGISLHQSGISIFQAAKDRMGLSQNQTIPGEILEVDTSSPNGISANVEPYAGNREEKKQYRVHIGTSIFLISNGITLVADPRELLLPPEDEKSALPSSSFHVVHVGIDKVYAGLILLSDSKAASTPTGSDGRKMTAAENLNMGTIQEHEF